VPDELMLGDLEAVIRDHARAATRSQQTKIGPSEIGQSCERRLALTLLGADKVNDERDEWTSTVGTAIHTWMEGAFLAANDTLQRAGLPPRWLVEQTVNIRPGLDGHCDVYDLRTHTVLDHKFPGVTSIRKYRKQGHPGRQYIWQAHLYGLGWAKLGLPVKKVAIAMYPRSGLIRDTWLWQADYDETIAYTALDRVDGLLVAMNAAESTGDLTTFLRGLERDTSFCSWCPYWTKGDRPESDPANGCAGEAEDPTAARPMQIAGIL
jgi:hypothetical protein